MPVQARELSKADFPLPTLAPVLAQLAEEVSHGRGFALVKVRCIPLQLITASFTSASVPWQELGLCHVTLHS